jgi:hypothetical protein
MMPKGQDDEYAALLAEHRKLQRDHELLANQRPVDIAAHRRHLARLHDHSKRLHRYIEERFKPGTGILPRVKTPRKDK